MVSMSKLVTMIGKMLMVNYIPLFPFSHPTCTMMKIVFNLTSVTKTLLKFSFWPIFDSFDSSFETYILFDVLKFGFKVCLSLFFLIFVSLLRFLPGKCYFCRYCWLKFHLLPHFCSQLLRKEICHSGLSHLGEEENTLFIFFGVMQHTLRFLFIVIFAFFF